MTLGEKLKKLRIEAGLFQKEAAQKAGIHTNTYAGYERGNRIPNKEAMEKLSEVLGCDLEYLMDDEGVAAEAVPEVAPAEATEAPAESPVETPVEEEETPTEKKGAKKKDSKKSSKKAEKEAKTAASKEDGAENVSHIFEIDGSQINTDDILTSIHGAFEADGHKVSDIKRLEIYYNFAERRAYYVVNGESEDKFVEF